MIVIAFAFHGTEYGAGLPMCDRGLRDNLENSPDAFFAQPMEYLPWQILFPLFISLAEGFQSPAALPSGAARQEATPAHARGLLWPAVRPWQ